MKRRIQITIGPHTMKSLLAVQRRMTKESGMNWSLVDTLEAAAIRGLHQQCANLKLHREQLEALRD